MVASSRKATLHDVAKRAHVSVASVSNYLNDYPYMKPATRERIQQAIDELGYVTNQQARNLRSGRTGLISLSLPDLNQIYFSELAEEMITRAREYGYRIIIESTGNDRQREIESTCHGQQYDRRTYFEPHGHAGGGCGRARGRLPAGSAGRAYLQRTCAARGDAQ